MIFYPQLKIFVTDVSQFVYRAIIVFVFLSYLKLSESKVYVHI